MANSHEAIMRAAIKLAAQNPKAPFAALLVNNHSGEIVAEGINRAKENPSWHGEIDVINRYAETRNPQWQNLTLYTTAEPCPMCMTAIAWAGIATVVYGCDIPTLVNGGWNQLTLRASDVIRATPFREIELIGSVLKVECDALFSAARQPTSSENNND